MPLVQEYRVSKLEDERYRHKFYCCQCINARLQKTGKELRICHLCVKRNFTCSKCFTQNCTKLNWEYNLALNEGMYCCGCFDFRGRLMTDEMCWRCLELILDSSSSSRSNGNDEESNSSSYRSSKELTKEKSCPAQMKNEEKLKPEPFDRDRSPVRTTPKDGNCGSHKQHVE